MVNNNTSTAIPLIGNSTSSIFSTTSIIESFRSHECEYFQYNRLALILWIVASVSCFLALISTIYTVFNAYQLWSTIQDLENAIIDLIDEGLQILLPIGICKQICHPHHIGTVNANYATKGLKQDVKPGTKDNRYPEDVTFPPSDIEKVYDIMGDEDARKSRTITVMTLDDQSLEEKPANVESDKKKPMSTPRTPNLPQKRTPSRENALTPKQSLKTANEGTAKKSASMEQAMSKEAVVALTARDKTPSREVERNKSRDNVAMVSSGGKKVSKSKESITPSAEKRTPSKEKESGSKKQQNPKMGTAEPIS